MARFVIVPWICEREMFHAGYSLFSFISICHIREYYTLFFYCFLFPLTRQSDRIQKFTKEFVAFFEYRRQKRIIYYLSSEIISIKYCD